jgi:hypothetical protein
MKNRYIRNFITHLLEGSGFVRKAEPALGDLFYNLREEDGAMYLCVGFISREYDKSLYSYGTSLVDLKLVNLLSAMDKAQTDFIKYNNTEGE